MHGQACARCGHTSRGCPRCGVYQAILGGTIDGKSYCHTYVPLEQRSCYQHVLWEQYMERLRSER